jgi:hypothetical protein
MLWSLHNTTPFWHPVSMNQGMLVFAVKFADVCVFLRRPLTVITTSSSFYMSQSHEQGKTCGLLIVRKKVNQ